MGKRITGKQRSARKKNIAIARKYRAKRGSQTKRTKKAGARTKRKWNTFSRAAKKEMGKGFTGSVTGDMVFGGKLSKSTTKKYWSYFKSLK